MGSRYSFLSPHYARKIAIFKKKHQYLGKFFCLAYKDGEKELKRDIEGNAIMINGCAGLKWTVIIMLSKYIQYFLDENNLEIGEEFMLTNENGRHIHPDKTFFFNGNPTSSRDILISKDEERFCPNILLGLLTGFYGVQKKPWQPEIGDVYFYVAVDEGRNKGVIHNETLFNKNNIKFLLLKKSGKYYKSYFEAEKHLKEDYEYLTGE